MTIANLSKFIVTAAGAITSGLETHYATAHWLPAVTFAITALVTYLVPNLPAPPVIHLSSVPAPPPAPSSPPPAAVVPAAPPAAAVVPPAPPGP